MAAQESYAGRKVLVTGAQGFVGSWLTERLLDAGATVVALRRDTEPESRFSTEGLEQRVVVAQADVLDYEAMLRVLNEHSVTTIFHLAAQTIVGTANRSPLSTFETNVRGTWLLLEAARSVGVVGDPVQAVVVASSDKAYGDHEQLPYSESFALQPRFPYDTSKACADLVARSYAETYEMPVAVTRLANVYGGGDMNWTRIVPGTARSLVAGERPVIRTDGTPERDYVHVDDAVDAYLAVAASLERPELRGRAWNAGSGTAVSARELVDRLIGVSGRELEPDVQGAGNPHGEIHRQYLDSTQIREELGWEPQRSLDDGLAASWKWYQRWLAG